MSAIQVSNKEFSDYYKELRQSVRKKTTQNFKKNQNT